MHRQFEVVFVNQEMLESYGRYVLRLSRSLIRKKSYYKKIGEVRVLLEEVLVTAVSGGGITLLEDCCGAR